MPAGMAAGMLFTKRNGGLEGLRASLCEAGFCHGDIFEEINSFKFFLILMPFFFTLYTAME